MLDALIGAGASLLGGFLNRESSDKANAMQAQQAELNRQMQLQFAKEGVRWKVDDARAAGIHPLYALGANTVSYSPVSVGSTADTSLGSAVASAGQDISRAMNATRTQGERDQAFDKTVRDLSLQKMGLENELLSSQIAKIRAGLNPPMPGVVPEANKPEERPLLFGGGRKLVTDEGTSNAEDFEKRYGEMSDWLAGPYIAWRDLRKNMYSGSDFARGLTDSHFNAVERLLAARNALRSWSKAPLPVRRSYRFERR